MARARSYAWAAAAVALFAVLIRLPHLGWGLPDIEEEALPLKKAFAMWGWQDGRLHLDPETAGWPSLSFYVHLLLQHLVYWAGRLGGAFTDRHDIYLLQRDMTPLVLAARALGVMAAGVVVLVGARLGRRLVGASWGAFAGLLAGAALAVSPLLYVESRLITPDILLVMFAALAVARIVDIHDRGRLRDYMWAAVWIGLGASAKYSPVLLVPVLYAVHLQRRRGEATAGARRRRGLAGLVDRLGLGDRRLLWAAVACAGSFALTSPYVILDAAVFQRDLAAQVYHLGGGGHFGHEARTWRSFFYLREVLAPALGWPGLLLAAAGLGWAAWRRGGAWLGIAGSVLALYLGLGFLSTQFERYMLPLLLPLALGLAATAAWLDARLADRPRALRLAAAAALAALVLLPPASQTLAAMRAQALPSTLQLAHRYIVDELADPDLFFAMEIYTPDLPLDRRRELEAQAAFARLSPRQQEELLGDRVFEVVYLPMNTINVEVADFYYDLRHLLPADVIVTSGAVRGRYERQPDRFPRQIAFYRDLERYAELARSFRPGHAARGPEIRIYRFTPAGRERLVQDRGLPAPGFYRPFQDRLHAPHFHAFLGEVAWHAYRKQMFGVADLFYQALDETTPPRPDRRFMSPHVVSRLELGELELARRMCEDALRREPDHLEALTLLGLALERQGDSAGAIAAYERCLALGEAAAAAGREPDPAAFFDGPTWAQRLLDALRARTDR